MTFPRRNGRTTGKTVSGNTIFVRLNSGLHLLRITRDLRAVTLTMRVQPRKGMTRLEPHLSMGRGRRPVSPTRTFSLRLIKIGFPLPLHLLIDNEMRPLFNRLLTMMSRLVTRRLSHLTRNGLRIFQRTMNVTITIFIRIVRRKTTLNKTNILTIRRNNNNRRNTKITLIR